MTNPAAGLTTFIVYIHDGASTSMYGAYFATETVGGSVRVVYVKRLYSSCKSTHIEILLPSY